MSKKQGNYEEKLMKEVMGKDPEKHIPDDQRLNAVSITLPFLQSLIKGRTEKDVYENNITLTKEYQYMVQMYGFTSLYDMYLFSLSNSQKEEAELGKSFHDKTRVEKTVTRNGTSFDIVVYLDLDSSEKVRKAQKPKQTHLEAYWNPTFTSMNREDIPLLQKSFEGTPHFKKATGSVDIYDNGERIGIVLVKEENDTITYLGIHSDHREYRFPVMKRGMAEVLLVSMKENLTASFIDDSILRPLYKMYGMKQQDGHWYADTDYIKSLWNT